MNVLKKCSIALIAVVIAIASLCAVKLIYEQEHTATVDPIVLTAYTDGDPMQQTDFSTTLLSDLTMHRQLFGGSALTIQLRFESLPPLPDLLADYADDLKNLLLIDGLRHEQSFDNGDRPNMATIYIGPYLIPTPHHSNLIVRLFLYLPGRVSLQVSQHDEVLYTIDLTGDFSPFEQVLTNLYN